MVLVPPFQGAGKSYRVTRPAPVGFQTSHGFVPGLACGVGLGEGEGVARSELAVAEEAGVGVGVGVGTGVGVMRSAGMELPGASATK